MYQPPYRVQRAPAASVYTPDGEIVTLKDSRGRVVGAATICWKYRMACLGCGTPRQSCKGAEVSLGKEVSRGRDWRVRVFDHVVCALARACQVPMAEVSAE